MRPRSSIQRGSGCTFVLSLSKSQEKKKQESRNHCHGRMLKVCLVGPIQELFRTCSGSPLCLPGYNPRRGILLPPAPTVSPRKINHAFQEGKVIFEIVIEKNSQIPRENNFSSGSISDHTPESFLWTLLPCEAPFLCQHHILTVWVLILWVKSL